MLDKPISPLRQRVIDDMTAKLISLPAPILRHIRRRARNLPC